MGTAIEIGEKLGAAIEDGEKLGIAIEDGEIAAYVEVPPVLLARHIHDLVSLEPLVAQGRGCVSPVARAAPST